jgi:hypothetical protein
MLERRHQVFVSSTYVDLVEERSEVMQALLELECMPAGMELFPAANDTQWDWIKRVIDESDYYIVIVAGRYGTISKDTGLSFTEMEYRYAVEQGKPVIGFLAEDVASLPAKNTEQQAARAKKLDAFRELVKTRLCKFYASPADLGAKVSRSITQLKKQHPTPGWVRADVLDSLASSDEVLAMKRENEELKQKLETLGLQRPATMETLASGSEQYKLEFVFVREAVSPETNRFKKVAEEWSSVNVSWDDMFGILGPGLLEAKGHYWSPDRNLALLAEARGYSFLEKKHPNERFKQFRVSGHCVSTVLLQLRALKLIALNDEKHWEVTPYGDNYLVTLLGVPKGSSSGGRRAI